MNVKINEKRLLDTFLKLVTIDSESYHEGTVHKHLLAELKKIGCAVFVDKAGKKNRLRRAGQYHRFAERHPYGQTVFCSLYIWDTVKPGKGIKPQVKGGRVTSDGTTILGADDKAGVAVVLEILRTLKEQKPDCGPVQGAVYAQ